MHKTKVGNADNDNTSKKVKDVDIDAVDIYGFTKSQEEQLKSRKMPEEAKSDAYRWRKISITLFPDDDTRGTPRASSETYRAMGNNFAWCEHEWRRITWAA
ncbi:hypothetical protein TruAng_009700 [Truncatella angustata]|nr:hypothetical protein TruAng_009700 [Truncatella angustata]